MQLVLDRDSFQTPFLAARAEADARLKGSGIVVKGASKRAEAAELDGADLKVFETEMKRRLREGTLAGLPALRTAYRRIPHCHHLTVGPWMGIFLIDPGGQLAIGLVFSRAPHDFLGRLQELVTLHTRIDPEGEDQGG